jgi:hypothetical protein
VSTQGGQAIIAIFGLLYLAGIALILAAIVITVVSLVRIARATERIARALEQRPPSQTS